MGNLLIFAPEGAECTYEGNVVIGGIAEKITLTHGKGFRAPQPFKAKDITYKRNFSMYSGNKTDAAGWEAIALPFDVQTFSNEKKGELAPFNSGKEGVKPFWLAEMTIDGFQHTTAMKANTPYIISMPNSDSYEDEFNISGEVLFHAEDTEGVEIKATSNKERVRIATELWSQFMKRYSSMTQCMPSTQLRMRISPRVARSSVTCAMCNPSKLI